jgi:hypothetical protein
VNLAYRLYDLGGYVQPSRIAQAGELGKGFRCAEQRLTAVFDADQDGALALLF